MIRCYRKGEMSALLREIGSGIFLGVCGGRGQEPARALVLFDGESSATMVLLDRLSFVVRWGHEFDPAFNKGQR